MHSYIDRHSRTVAIGFGVVRLLEYIPILTGIVRMFEEEGYIYNVCL